MAVSEEAIGRIELVQNGSVVASKVPRWLRVLLLFSRRRSSFGRVGGSLPGGWIGRTGTRRIRARSLSLLVDSLFARARRRGILCEWIDNLIQQTSPGGGWSNYLDDKS